MKVAGAKLIEWVEKLHEAGATLPGKDGVEVNPVVRQLISAMHTVLAGDAENATYKVLEEAFEASWEEANSSSEKAADGEPPALLP